MIGISIATEFEWEATIKYFNISKNALIAFPYGEYFKINLREQDIIFYCCGSRKVNSAGSAQYMINHFNLEKLLVIGTCAGIDDKYKPLDIIIPNLACQYDCTVKEIEPLIKLKFNVKLDLRELDFEFNTGTIGTADKAVVMWKDYLELKENNITIADTEAAGIAYICKLNNIKCLIIKGISDFPKNEDYSSKNESNEEQLNTYFLNIPKVMTKIFTDYLEKVI